MGMIWTQLLEHFLGGAAVPHQPQQQRRADHHLQSAAQASQAEAGLLENNSAR